MKRLLIMLALVLAFSADADAQGWLKKLKDKAVEKVKEKVENKLEREVDKATDEVLDGKKSSKKSKKSKGDDDAEVGDEEPDAQTSTSSDFKRGEVILF